MWPKFVEQLELPDWKSELRVFDETPEGEIIDGILLDGSDTRRYFIIQDGILDLLDDNLADIDRRNAFFTRYRQHCKDLILPAGHDQTDQPQTRDKLLQRTHHDHEAKVYDSNLSDTPYGYCSDQMLFDLWKDYLVHRKIILDLGCGTGRRGILAAGMTQAHYTGIDISYGMVEQARLKFASAGLLSDANFCVADVEKTLVKPQSADIILVTGVLHHAASPLTLITQAQRALRPGGYFLSYENNHSILRGVFDFLQTIIPTWHEQGGAHQVISAAELDAWFGQAGEFNPPAYRYHIYLPPHIFNLVGKRLGCYLMTMSDSFGRALPWIKRHAGIIIIRAQKK